MVEGPRRYDTFSLFYFNDDCRGMSHGLGADSRFFRKRRMRSLTLVQAALGDEKTSEIFNFQVGIFFLPP